MIELEQSISQFFGVSKEDVFKLTPFFHRATLKKGECYLAPGTVCNSLSFQLSGYARFFVNSDGKEVTQWISSKGGLVADLAGLIFNKPSNHTIQALEDCDLFTIDGNDYRHIADHIPTWHQLEKLFIAKCFIFMEERIFSLLSMNMEERYKWLFAYYPDLFNRVPLQYLASMMGMTPETLSRIRKKHSEQRLLI